MANVRLGDVAKIRHGFAFDGEFFVETPKRDVLVTPGNFAIGGGFKGEKLKFYEGPVDDEFVLHAGDLIITMTDLSKSADTLGYAALVPVDAKHRYLHNQRIGKVRVTRPDLAEQSYLHWLLRGPAYRAEVLAGATGTTVKHTAPVRVEAFEFNLPSLHEQRAIAHILSTLDDKIDLNRRMNETLEAMARALFKSWFVDFDPVRAKAEGHAPSGMDAETAKLFPSAFEESGSIPLGWQTSTLGSAVERWHGTIQTGPFGSQLHASDYVEHGVPVIMPKDIAGRRVVSDSIARIRESDAQRLSRHRVQAGDIVYSRRGDVERHAFISDGERGWLCGTGCLLVRPGASCPSSVFVSIALDQRETRAWISQHAIGATMPNLNTGILAAVPFVCVQDEALRAFGRVVDPLQQLVVAHQAQSESLAAIRDALLPKLLSGEISVAHAERAVEAAT